MEFFQFLYVLPPWTPLETGPLVIPAMEPNPIPLSLEVLYLWALTLQCPRLWDLSF